MFVLVRAGFRGGGLYYPEALRSPHCLTDELFAEESNRVGTHPSASGHGVWADRVAPFLPATPSPELTPSRLREAGPPVLGGTSAGRSLDMKAASSRWVRLLRKGTQERLRLREAVRRDPHIYP